MHKVLRSLIHETFDLETRVQIELLSRRRDLINQEKHDELIKLLREKDIGEVTLLGPGTNRYAFKVNGFVVKVATDHDGKIDNMKEFKMAKRLFPYVAKTYEVSENGTLLIAEYIQPFTDFQEMLAHADRIREILRELSTMYLIGDVGITSKNFSNWGLRVGTDDPVCLDFAYVYEVSSELFLCRKCSAHAMLHPDENFTKLLCPVCEKPTSFEEIRTMIGNDIHRHQIGDLGEEGYRLYESNVDTELTEERSNYLANTKPTKQKEEQQMDAKRFSELVGGAQTTTNRQVIFQRAEGPDEQPESVLAFSGNMEDERTAVTFSKEEPDMPEFEAEPDDPEVDEETWNMRLEDLRPDLIQTLSNISNDIGYSLQAEKLYDQVDPKDVAIGAFYRDVQNAIHRSLSRFLHVQIYTEANDNGKGGFHKVFTPPDDMTDEAYRQTMEFFWLYANTEMTENGKTIDKLVDIMVQHPSEMTLINKEWIGYLKQRLTEKVTYLDEDQIAIILTIVSSIWCEPLSVIDHLRKEIKKAWTEQNTDNATAIEPPEFDKYTHTEFTLIHFQLQDQDRTWDYEIKVDLDHPSITTTLNGETVNLDVFSTTLELGVKLADLSVRQFEIGLKDANDAGFFGSMDDDQDDETYTDEEEVNFDFDDDDEDEDDEEDEDEYCDAKIVIHHEDGDKFIATLTQGNTCMSFFVDTPVQLTSPNFVVDARNGYLDWLAHLPMDFWFRTKSPDKYLGVNEELHTANIILDHTDDGFTIVANYPWRGIWVMDNDCNIEQIPLNSQQAQEAMQVIREDISATRLSCLRRNMTQLDPLIEINECQVPVIDEMAKPQQPKEDADERYQRMMKAAQEAAIAPDPAIPVKEEPKPEIPAETKAEPNPNKIQVVHRKKS